MEETFIFFSAIFVLSFACISYLFCYKNKSELDNLPPGKTGLPYLGETLKYLRAGQKGHPEKFISERMHKFSSKVFRTSLFGEPVAVFCGVAGNKFLFSNEEKLVRAWYPESAKKIFPTTQQTSVQEEGMKTRKILPNFLNPDALKTYIGIMDAIARKHIGSDWTGKREVTVFPLAKMYTLAISCRVFLSIEEPEQIKNFAVPLQAFTSGIISVPINLPGTYFNRGMKAGKVLQKEVLKIIKQRKADLAEKKGLAQDILSHMLTRADENGEFMSEMNVADKIIGLLVGGHDTASGVITSIVKYLAELPQVYHKVYEEQMEIANSKNQGELLDWDDIQKMKYSWNVACETMRLSAPLQGGFKEALTDFTFNGYSIPKGWKLHWNVNSTHTNSEYFEEPEKFKPSRFEGSGPEAYTYVPFGGGARICPGKEFARLEILVFMHNIVKSFKWEKSLPFEKDIVNPFRVPARGLPIRLHPHTS